MKGTFEFEAESRINPVRPCLEINKIVRKMGMGETSGKENIH